MTPPASASAADRSRAHPATPDGSTAHLVVFVVLAAVLAARLLIPETLHPAVLSFLPDTPVGTTPATTVRLDALLLVAAAAARLMPAGRRRHPRTVDVGLVLLLVAVVISTWAAADRRAAANAGADLFVLAAAGVSLLRLARPGWMVRLLLAAALAGGVAGASKCIIQRTSEFPATIEQWQQQKAGLIARGVDPNAPEIVNYERRMRSQNAYGYLNHPNVTASILAAAALLAAGLLAGVVRRDRPAGQWSAAALLALAAVGVLLVGIVFTASRGALVALTLGLIVLAAAVGARRWIAGRPRAALGLLAAGYLGLIGAGAAWGLARGTLPGASLAFRWEYWRAAARAVRDAPLTGIGADNFRAAYMRYKPPESTEEVENPHNLWVALLVELGPLGLLAGVLLAGAAVRAAFAAAASASGSNGDANADMPRRRRAPTACGVAVAGLVLATWSAATGMPFAVAGDAFGAVLLLWIVFDAGVWLVAYGAGWWLLGQVGDERTPCVAGGVLAALVALLIHNLIGFSLLTPAGLATFALLAVAATRLQTDPREPADPTGGERRSPRLAGLIVRLVAAGAVLAAYGALVAVPVTRADAQWQAFKSAIRAAQDETQIAAALKRARAGLAADPWNAELPRLIGSTTLELARRPHLSPQLRDAYLEDARGLAELALKRNASSFAARYLRAEILDELAASGGDERTLAQAAAAWDEALRLYPTNPRARIEAGLAWVRLWEKTREPDAARRAVEHFTAAIAIDATRPPQVAAKLRKRELRTIREQIDRLRSVLATQPAGEGS